MLSMYVKFLNSSDNLEVKVDDVINVNNLYLIEYLKVVSNI